MAHVIKVLARDRGMVAGGMLAGGIMLLSAASGFGEEPTVARKQILTASLPRHITFDEAFSAKHSLPASWASHPLAPALMLAYERGAYLRTHVRDFTCLLVKRERINGQLRDYEYLATKVRREQRENDQITTPYSVFSVFLGPAKIKGRKVLFVDGDNEGKMLVRNGGARFNYITVKLDPDSAAAMRESRYPITELGLESLTQRIIDQTLLDIQVDPTGENSKVNFFRDARVDKRPCLHIQVVHPKPHEQFTYHIANIYIDNELQMPIRVETYDWPQVGNDEMVLQEEYTMTRLKLNVGLTDADFSLSALEGK